MGQVNGKEPKSEALDGVTMEVESSFLECMEIQMTLKDHLVTNYKKRHKKKFYRDLEKKLMKCNITLNPKLKWKSNDNHVYHHDYDDDAGALNMKTPLKDMSDTLSISSLTSEIGSPNFEDENTKRKTVINAEMKKSHTSLCERVYPTDDSTYQDIHFDSDQRGQRSRGSQRNLPSHEKVENDNKQNKHSDSGFIEDSDMEYSTYSSHVEPMSGTIPFLDYPKYFITFFPTFKYQQSALSKRKQIENVFGNYFEKSIKDFFEEQKLQGLNKSTSLVECIEKFDEVVQKDPFLTHMHHVENARKAVIKLVILGVELARHQTLQAFPIHGLRDYFQLMSVQVSERPPHGETMRFEWVRVRSFWSFPSNVHVSPVGLARVGFYYTGKVSECKCFCCGAVYKDWKDGDDPYALHRQISPTCPYLNGLESGNIPIHEEDRMSPRPQVTQTLFASSLSEPRGAEGFTRDENLPGIINSELSRIPVPQGGEGSSHSGDFSFNKSASEQTAPSTQQASVSEPGTGFFSRPQVPNAGLPSALSANQQPTASENVPAIDPAGQFALQLPPRTEGPATTQPTLVLRPGQLSSNSGLPSLASQSIQPRIQFNEGSNANRATSAQSVSSTNQPTTSTRSNLLPPTTTATVASLSTSSNASRTASTANTASTTASTSSSGSTTGYSGPSTEPLTRHSGYTGPSTEPTTARAAAVSDSSRSRFDPLGINFEKPKYPAYAVLTVRMNTYNGWPAYLDQSPRNMSLAGFFYAGYGDYTRCFFCGGGLRNWEAGDDPWVEHARWFPKCAFLRQNQGERFVNVVQQKHQEAEATNQPMVLPRQQSVLDQGHAGSDIMASVCVQTLRDFGKDDRIIKEAIEKWQRSRRSGAPVNSSDLQATEIYEIILQIEDESVRRGLPGQIQQAALPVPSTSQPNNQLVASGEQSEGATADQEQFPELDKVFDEWLTNKMKLTCKICHDKPVAIAFLPCGHLVCCHDCAPAMRKCPSCHHVVKGTIKTFFP